MSLVVFPFKNENPEVLLKNIKIALSHPRVGEVLCVGAEEDVCFHSVAQAIPTLISEFGKPVKVMLQERIGKLRPGKGDGMNTGLRYFVEKTSRERIHFYDADLLSFTPQWITKAEEAADLGYQVVRHYFPRASTDGMITWFITRPGFAILWPRSELPRIQQPLGGELLLTREVAEKFVEDPRIQNQSDWGIDTLYTFGTVAWGYSIYETYMAVGKLHKLYGTLADLRTMLVECFAAIQSLAGEQVPSQCLHHVEYPGSVPEEVKTRVGFDFDGTLALLAQGWTKRQAELFELFPSQVRKGLLSTQRYPQVTFMDEDAWYETYLVLLKHFQREDPDWQELLFKLWICRVLTYTVKVALRGYDVAMQYLHETVERYIRKSALNRESTRSKEC